MLVEYAFSGAGTTAAAGCDAHRIAQVFQRAGAKVGALADFAVGDGVAKTYVHGATCRANITNGNDYHQDTFGRQATFFIGIFLGQ